MDTERRRQENWNANTTKHVEVDRMLASNYRSDQRVEVKRMNREQMEREKVEQKERQLREVQMFLI